jgi:protein SCO1/2
MKRVACVLVILLSLAACRAKSEKPVSVPGERVFVVKGKIVARDAKDNTVRVDHEAVPGLMDAMTMDYSVRGAKVGDLPPNNVRVTAKLHSAGDAFWLTDIVKAR